MLRADPSERHQGQLGLGLAHDLSTLGPRGTAEQLAAPFRACKTCGLLKPREDFYLRSPKARAKTSEAAARDRHCKECVKKRHAENGRKYRAKYPERRLDRFRLWKYGLTKDAFEALWTDQRGRCGVCRTALDRMDTKAIHVDHDHARGVVRGLLCPTCSLGLGSFHDDPKLLRAAVRYLAKPRA